MEKAKKNNDDEEVGLPPIGDWTKKIKNIQWWIDNILLIILIIVVLYFGIKGHYTDVRVIETCYGQPTTPDITLIT